MHPPLARRQDVVLSLRRHSITLAGVQAGRGFADLQPLKAVIGSARIVALGEATHGSREFFQLKHRLLEFLVVEMGFTTFAIEANWPESLAVNDYVLHGQGDPATVLAGLHFWTWNTEEVLDLIRWMRQYNITRAENEKVKFAGFDAQFSGAASISLAGYLASVDPAFSAEISQRLALFEKEQRDYSLLPAAGVDALHVTVVDVAKRLRDEERPYVAQSSVQQWRVACQHARILRQVDELRRAHGDDKAWYVTRDRSMAENVAWILENEGPRCKMVLWAHNGHVARDARGIFGGAVVSMGMHLARSFGPELVVIGFAFGEGSFQAVVTERGNRRPIREVTVGPAADGSLDDFLAQTGTPVLMLDLRHVDEDLAHWLREPRTTREIGAFFEHEEDMRKSIVPSARYDVVAFVDKTTRARPNATPAARERAAR